MLSMLWSALMLIGWVNLLIGLFKNDISYTKKSIIVFGLAIIVSIFRIII